MAILSSQNNCYLKKAFRPLLENYEPFAQIKNRFCLKTPLLLFNNVKIFILLFIVLLYIFADTKTYVLKSLRDTT